MSYLPPFAFIQKKFNPTGVNGKARIDMSQTDFLEMLKLLLRAVPVDEAWYLRHYPDVAGAITKGLFKSARHHFIEEGYFEGRLPYPLKVDDAWYRSKYPDVADGLKSGVIESATAHFQTHGYLEGRLPSEY